MATITTHDGTEIFYKDWGSGRPVVFSHGWPLTADAWDGQLRLVASSGYRAIAHDRRGGGRSGQVHLRGFQLQRKSIWRDVAGEIRLAAGAGRQQLRLLGHLRRHLRPAQSVGGFRQFLAR